MISVNAYIDGFNLYHAIHRLNDPRLKWYNIKILVQRYLQSKDSLRNIYFYTAKPEHCNERVQERFFKMRFTAGFKSESPVTSTNLSQIFWWAWSIKSKAIFTSVSFSSCPK